MTWRTLRWELWVLWRRFMGRCIHNSKVLRAEPGAPWWEVAYVQCNDCGTITYRRRRRR